MTCDCGNEVPGGFRVSNAAGICDRCVAMDGLGPTQFELVQALVDGPMTSQELRRHLGIKDKGRLWKVLQAMTERGRVRKAISEDLEHGEDVTWVLCDPARQARRTA